MSIHAPEAATKILLDEREMPTRWYRRTCRFREARHYIQARSNRSVRKTSPHFSPWS